MKRISLMPLAFLLAFCLFSGNANANVNTDADVDDVLDYGTFLGSLTSTAGYVPGSSLHWRRDEDAFIQQLAIPGQLDPNHPRYNPLETHRQFESERSSITPYQQVVFSDVDCTFSITYSFDEGKGLCTILLRAGPTSWGRSQKETEAAWAHYAPALQDILKKLYDYNGIEITEKKLLDMIKRGHTEYPGIRAFFEHESGTFMAVSTEVDFPGITIIAGLREYISPNFALERLWMP